MTHVWQYEHVGSQYLAEAFHAGEIGDGYQYGTSKLWSDDGNGVELKRRRDQGDTMAAFNREQQGDIARHYYMRRENNRDISNWQPYIDDLRAGRG
jgi:hypothetical protein